MVKTDDSANYQRHVLQQNEYFEIVSCHWGEGDFSPLHSHGWSQCFSFVEQGVFENKTFSGSKEELILCEKGQVFVTPAGARHEMRCLSKNGKTLHIYIPRLAEKSSPNNFKTQTMTELKSKLDLQLGPHGERWDQLLKSIGALIGTSVQTHSPYFMNQLFSGVLPETLLAEETLAKTRTTLATFEASPALSLVEMEVVRNLTKLIGWPDGEGIAVPGGSAANFMALHCARQRKFPNYKTEGFTPGVKSKIFVSEEAHYSFQKACVTLGFGLNSLVKVKADAQGRMLCSDLKQKIEHTLSKKEVPLFICATAGTTVFGAFDPVSEIVRLGKQFGCWVHVDAAWGGPALFSTKLRPLMAGVEHADSVTFDGHKFFGGQLTSSFFLTQDPRILLEANDVSGGEYLFHESTEIIDRGRLSWQCGRKADALSFWTLWKSYGTEGLGRFVDKLVRVRDESLPWIENQSRLKLIAKPEFLNLCVQIEPPSGHLGDAAKWSQTVRGSLKDTDQAMVNYSTSKDGTTFLRLILVHPELEVNTVQQILSWALAVQ